MHRFDSFVPTAVEIKLDTDYPSLLERMGQRDRQTVERHVASCEEEPSPDHANLWKRLACLLASIAGGPGAAAAAASAAGAADPLPTTKSARQYEVHAAGQRALQFFVPDGKYRRQVFALEDLRDGVLVVYSVDALDAALRAGALQGPVGTAEDGAGLYRIRGCGGDRTVKIQLLNAANLGSAPDYFRHMVGWNRTALKVTVPITADDDELRSLNVLYALAVRSLASGE
ncbi:MAG TPA: hypothetical protein VH475_02925 [Tepidisphaeraceae bacterium]|jgi:hypothetical protein